MLQRVHAKQLRLVTFMRGLVWLILSLTLCACSGAGKLMPQQPRSLNALPSYRHLSVSFPASAFRNPLLVSVDGMPLQHEEISADDAIRQTITNSLRAVSSEVTVIDSMLTFEHMQQQHLDAFFWLQDVTIRSSLDREGTLFPSYTSYSSVTIKLMRMSGFRGTLDSLVVYGSGSYYSHGLGSSRSRIAAIGAEIALNDLANKIARTLTVTVR